MSKDMLVSEEHFVTPVGVASFTYLEKPDTGRRYSKGKYKLDIIFSKKTEFTRLKKEALDIAMEMWDDVDDLSDLDFLPFKDGNSCMNKDQEVYAGYEGGIYITVNSSFPVSVFDQDNNPAEASLVYNGAKVRAVVVACAYESGRQRGVSFLLQAVKFIDDGPRLTGGGISQEAVKDLFNDADDDAPKKKKRKASKETTSKKKRKVVEEEVDEEEEYEDEEEEEEPKPKKKRKRRTKAEIEADRKAAEEDDEEDVEEEEGLPPTKTGKTSKKKSGSDLLDMI